MTKVASTRGVALAVALVMAGSLALWAGMPGSARAQADSPAQADPAARGPSTGLPLPRFVSLKSTEGRARRGPNRSHRVDWIYTRRDLPLRVTAEFEHWRRVEDFEGEGGWMHYSLLSGVRTALVVADMAPMRSRPRPDAPEVAILEQGVVGRIDSCQPAWCEIRTEDRNGWVERSALWGIDPQEVLE